MNLLVASLAVLVTLPSIILGGPVRLEVFDVDLVSEKDCYNNSLTLHVASSSIDRGFVESQTVKCLNIEHGQITYVTQGAFDEVPNLTYLSLEGNRITPRDLFSFGGLKSIRTLILSNQVNQYDGKELVIQGVYPQLRYLDLRNNSINSVRSLADNPFPVLKHLDLSMNRIVYFDFANLLPSTLSHLYLNRNSISRFSGQKFSNLMVLSLDGNNIDSIGDVYYGLNLTGARNLKSLSVGSNRIAALSKQAFKDNVNLQYLNLSSNSLSSLHSDTLESLQMSLQVLVLDGNSFDDIPISTIMNLTTLSMNCNGMKHLTVNPLLNMPYLKKLYLGGNTITDINSFAFRFQTRLEELYLNDNNLTYLQDQWADYMSSLRLLDLSGNRFELLDSLLKSPVAPIREIYFDRNPLKYINAAAFKAIPENATIHLQENPNRIVGSCRPTTPSVATEWPSTTGTWSPTSGRPWEWDSTSGSPWYSTSRGWWNHYKKMSTENLSS
ncbi:PREDICTED: leucine-rich repeat-containing protein 15-like [Dufourea novaeangliae]|uniref:Leucine-rich repeat-containing protein 15 n=1 Tax=Dufourea novaeangliae TaxID=178035 RepID=A0A154P337_DUFNO|nr:PREDICTED: leucine-rich repeat-containing protein 15-like [Dufourea novaeangliae]XP_015440020.1 PREDICTED: leucine-rich repeat-containing protein 15-like [Dufourea novaeangliae]KZC06349.1 Leucine-rich repeat-containing protein 15 [Dufourea novaeangliae]